MDIQEIFKDNNASVAAGKSKYRSSSNCHKK